MTMTSDELATAAADHLWLHFSPLARRGRAPLTVIERGEGGYVWDDARASATSTGWPASSSCRPATAAARSPRPAAKQAEQARLLPALDLRPPDRHRAGRPARRPRARRPQPGVLHHRRRRGRRVGVEAGPPVLPRHRPARPRTRSSAGTPPTTAPPSARSPSPASTPSRSRSLPLLTGQARHVPNTNRYRCTARRRPTAPLAGADAIEATIIAEGPETVAAVYLEPVQNAGGCFSPPTGYFQRVREICDRHGVLLVSDEVICAFGRLGDWFGAEPPRLPARHDHHRQGPHLGLRAARRRAW